MPCLGDCHGDRPAETCIRQVLRVVVVQPVRRCGGSSEQRRITAALERLGWERKRDMHGRWWQPREAAQ